MITLEEAVHKYLHARYWMLRERELPKTMDCQARLLDAEDTMWEVLTGKRDFMEAFVAAGGKLAKVDRNKVRGANKKVLKRKKLKPGGFF